MATAITELNGLDLQAMQGLVETVTKDPSAADPLKLKRKKLSLFWR